MDIGWITGRLGQALAALDDGNHLTIEVKSTARYVQFASFDGRLRSESVGDLYLNPALWLGERATLAELGWNDPDEGGNYWIHWDSPVGFEVAAAHAVETLERVHRATSFHDLSFSAADHLLAALFGPDAEADGRAPSDDVLNDGLRDGRFIAEDNLVRELKRKGEPPEHALDYLRDNRVLVWPLYPVPENQRTWTDVEEAAHHQSSMPSDLFAAGASSELQEACGAERRWLRELGWTIPWAR